MALAPSSMRLVALVTLPGALVCVAGALVVAAPTAHARGPGEWQWPLEPQPRVVRAFDPPSGPYGPGHRGVDLEAAVGQPVRAAGSGRVSFAGPVAGRGVVSVTHADGRRTSYEPVIATVSRGDPVSAGDVLGRVSAAPGHCLPGTCLHWGLRRGDTYLDPLGLVGASAVRLLPLWAAPPPVRPSRSVRAQVLPSRAGPVPARGPLMAGLGPRP